MPVYIEVDKDRADRIHIAAQYHMNDLIKTIPGATWSKTYSRWTIPLSWTGCLAARTIFGNDLVIGPDLSQWAKNERVSRIDPAMALRDALDAPGDSALYGYQRAGVEFLITAERALLCDEMGCISGDAELIINRGGKGFRLKMRDLYLRFHNLGTRSGKSWSPDIQTRTTSMWDDGSLGLNTVVDVVARGDQPVITITTASGNSVTCTRDHRMSVSPGSWVAAGDLCVGDTLMLNGVAACKRCGSTEQVATSSQAKYPGYCRSCIYRYMRDNYARYPDTNGKHLDSDGYVRVSGQWEHPNADKYGYVTEHVLVMSEHLGRAESGEHVHHVDRDKTNNDLSNLRLLTAVEHHLLHAAEDDIKMHLNGSSGSKGAVWFRAHSDTIVSIEESGVTDVYDIEMAAPAHSFVVNGVVVHNSGKTITTIRAAKKLHDDGEDVFPMLVVCPNTMKRTWAKELDKWWPGVTSVVVGGTAVQRRKQIESGAQIIIINWEGLRSHSRLAKYGSLALRRCQECGGSGTVKEGQCQTHERELNRIDFNTVIADELHRSKNPSSQVAMALRGASGAAHYRFGLTGTPISGNPVEMWPLLHWIDEREWPAKTKWVDRMVSYTYDLWGGMEVTGIRPEAEDEFHASINPRMRRMTKDVVLPFLPPKIYEQREVSFTGKQAKAYQQMADDLVAKLDSGILLSANPMVQTGRLIQFASAYGDLEVLPDGSDRLVLADPSNKIDAFMADLEDFDGQAVVVFAQSKQLINLLSTTLTKKSIRHGLITGDQDTAQRQRTIEDFQDGHFNMVLCTIQAGGVGITLTRASVAVFLQRSWSPIDMQQAEDRIHRIGSEIHENVLIVNYVTPDTVEEAQIWALKHKNDLLQEIVRDAALMKKFLMGELGR